jgi:lipoprotein-anchoring transpeptidase ErfK/SrfK
VIALATVVGFGAAAYLFVPWHDDAADAAAGAPKVAPTGPFKLVAWPPPDSGGIPPETTIKVEAQNGRITELVVTAPDGTTIPGYLAAGGEWWVTQTMLAPATVYEVRADVVPDRGKRHREHWSFTTVTPSAFLGARVIPGDNEVVGVGQPISIRFTEPVTNKRAVEQRLKVTTSVPVAGAWRWMDDREIHWRPRDYWPANTAVFLDADLTGVDAGNGVVGNVHRTVHYSIGDAHVSVANAATHTLTVTENGAVIKTFPMSSGKDEFPTMSGKHLVLGKSQKVVMDSRTNGIPLDSPDGYLEDVFWDTQISSTGEYVHAAPWSVNSQGRRNVSHGCINLSTANAEWFFNWSRRGDVVEVMGTPRPPNNDISVVDWKLGYDEWRQGSALYNPLPPPEARIG